MEVLFEGGANTQQSDGQCLQPVSRSLAHEGCLELAMEPFHQTVGAGVVGGGSDTGDAEEFIQVYPKVGIELASSVRSEGGWDANTRYPTQQECLGDSFRSGVVE